jgi:hypothetical protein
MTEAPPEPDQGQDPEATEPPDHDNQPKEDDQ